MDISKTYYTTRDDKPTCYLAYGSNLHPSRLNARLRSASLITTVVLSGWTINFSKIGRDGSGKCNIIEASDELVYAAIYRVSQKDLEKLDHIEGVGNGYVSSELEIPAVGSCKVYLAQEAFTDPLQQPYNWYKQLVLAGARLHAFPATYIKKLESVKSKIDSNTERSLINLSVLVSKVPEKNQKNIE